MKVCKFEKIKDEDEMKQVINCIQKEHPYVAVVPILAQLQEWLQAISISWFHEEDEASHTTVNAIEAYCCTLANHLITDSHLNQEIKNRILECIKKIHILVEDKADLLIDNDKSGNIRIIQRFIHLLLTSTGSSCPNIRYRQTYTDQPGKKAGYPIYSGIYPTIH